MSVWIQQAKVIRVNLAVLAEFQWVHRAD